MNLHVRHRGDSGFTLAEVLVAVVIEALVVGALSMAFIGILRGTAQVGQSLSKSADARIAAAYVISDASNSSGPEISLTDTTTCADPDPPVTGTPAPVVRFDSTSTNSAGANTPDIVIYSLVSSTGVAPFSFVRRACQNGVLISDRVLAASVASVTVTCSPSATPQCSGTPTSITVTITETADTNGSAYQYSLTGTFEKLIGDGQPFSGGVVLLGAGPTCSGTTSTIDISGAASMRVYGQADINTADGTSCQAMTLGNSGSFQAGNLSILQGGSCHSVTNGLLCPPWTTYAPAVTDPYARLQAPSTTGLAAQTGCTGPSGTQTAQPGLYSGGFSLGGGNTCTLASGVYVVEGGFNVGNGATLLTGTGGVLIYLLSGQFAVDGGASVTLTATTSSTYDGVVVWQAAADTDAISLSNGGTIVFNGAIYGKTAQLNITGNAQTPIVTALVVQTIVLTNSGGITVGAPSVPGLSISSPATLPAAPVNTTYPNTTLQGAGGDGNYTWAASNLPSGLSINPSTGVISGTTPSTPVSKSVTVTLTDALGDNPATQTFTLNIDALPTVTATSPASRGQGATNQNIVVTGTGFINGTGLAASFSGTGITVNSTTYTSATSVTANITIAAGASTGVRNVTVTNPDTGAGTGTAVFTVNAAPTVTSTTPASRPQGATTQNVVIAGTGFVNGTGLAASFSGTGITVNSTTYTSATSVTANITIAAGASTGVRDVTVTNPDAGAGTATGVFTVNAAPTVTSTNPASLPRGATAQNVTITGSNFVNGAVAAFSGTGITVNSTLFVNSSQLTANITITTAAATGARNVTVINPDTGVGTGTGIFTVDALPTITSTSPSSRGQGATTQNITITGTGFINGTGLAASFSGTGITVNSTTFNSATSLTANITIAAGATTGSRAVTVTNPDSGVGTGTNVFTVNAAPTITSLNPATHTRNLTGVSVIITGTGFVSGATVQLVATAGTAPTVVTTTWNSATQITIKINIPNATSTDNVIVTNPDGGTVTKTGGFQAT